MASHRDVVAELQQTGILGRRDASTFTGDQLNKMLASAKTIKEAVRHNRRQALKMGTRDAPVYSSSVSAAPRYPRALYVLVGLSILLTFFAVFMRWGYVHVHTSSWVFVSDDLAGQWFTWNEHGLLETGLLGFLALVGLYTVWCWKRQVRGGDSWQANTA